METGVGVFLKELRDLACGAGCLECWTNDTEDKRHDLVAVVLFPLSNHSPVALGLI
jgi:hypothetical protein